jgi:rhamnogalacturonan acetylesterase
MSRLLFRIAIVPLVPFLALPATAARPTLFLIGDSTVRNGANGQVGWGEVIGDSFDRSKIDVRNRAIGGRSSRTFFTEGRWDKVLAEMKPGDFVIMQFGHNDGGPLTGGKGRASIKANGDETEEVTNPSTGEKETVHSYGWYLRRYIEGAKEKGATAIVCSLIPRNIWKDNKVIRATNDYGKWAAEAARQGGALFIDLNQIIADKYDALGADKVLEYFPGDHTHTNAAGAKLNAACVVEGIKGLKDCPLASYLATTPDDK